MKYRGRKIRGQRRYYRRLATDQTWESKAVENWIALVEDNVKSAAGFNTDHIHYSPAMFPLFRLKGIKPHLDAMFRAFERLAVSCRNCDKRFQLWALIQYDRQDGIEPILNFNIGDAEDGYSSVKFSENNFSTKFNLPEILEGYMSDILRRGYSVRYGTDGLQRPFCIIYRQGLGEN